MRTNGNRRGDDQILIERELNAVDSAIAGKPVDAEFADLHALASVLRSDRPRPDGDFAAELDGRALAGFPPERPVASGESPASGVRAAGRGARQRGSRLSRLRFHPRRMPLAFGAAASLLIGVTAILSSGVLSGDGGGGNAPPNTFMRESGKSSGAPTGAEPAAPRTRSQADTAGGQAAGTSTPSVPVVPARPRVLPHVRNRQVERAAAVTLASPPREVEDTADGVIEVTDRYGGFVLRSSVSDGDDRNRSGATLDLRIPSERLQPALRDLSRLAHVRSRTQTTEDITGRFVSARSRLKDAVTERRALLRQLGRATTPNEAATIRARLRLTNRQIAVARSHLRGLRNRVQFSAVSVAIEPDQILKADNGSWTITDAFHDALDVLATAAGVALLTLAVLLPLSLLGLLGWAASSKARQVRRERVLDGQPAVSQRPAN